MSWTCSQVLADQFSQANLITTEQSLQLKSTRTAERFYFDGKKRGTSKRSPSGMTSTPSTLLSGMASLMSSLLDSPAKDSLSQANKEEQPTPETNGRKRNESSKKFDQAELFSKTSPEFESTSKSWPETLPIWGMIVSGELFPLEKPEPCTLERDGIVWPTPTVNGNRNRKGLTTKSGDGLETAAKNWPTPLSRDWEAGHGPRYLRKRSSDLNDAVDYNENYETIWPTPTTNTRPNEGNVRLLRKQVLEGKLSEEEATNMLEGKSPFDAQGKVDAWPTPSVTDSGGGILRDIEVSSTGSFSRKNKDGVRWRVPLRDAVPAHEKKWPTPNAHEPRLGYQDRSKGKKGTRLNPDWVEWLMGWPIGWTSLDPLPAENFDAWVALLLIGEWWHNDPAECGSVHRLTSKVPTRKQRLTAIGNGWVPQQAILAQQILTLA